MASASSAYAAIGELSQFLSGCLLHRFIQHILNPDLVNDLLVMFIPDTPENFEDACRFFRVFFANISNPGVNFCCTPILFPNIFLAIKNFKCRIKVFKRILAKQCREYYHYEALFAVMCEVLNNPVSNKPQIEKFFILRFMIHTRIEQRQQFPPGPGSKLTHLCKESIDEIIEMIFKKHGMRDREETREAMKSRLRYGFNAYYHDIYSEQIILIIQSDPTFFETWEPVLKRFFSADVRSAEKEKVWLNILEVMCPDFWKALSQERLCNQTKSKKKITRETKYWILSWYVRHIQKTRFVESADRETFSGLMKRLVLPEQMSFPFRNPPKLFLNNDGHFRDLALKWGTVLSEDLLEICLLAHEPTTPYVQKHQ
jgi:hypothetical protein